MFARARTAAGRWRHTRTARVLAIVAAALVGGWLGLLIGGNATTALGPADVRLSLTPSWTSRRSAPCASTPTTARWPCTRRSRRYGYPRRVT